MSTRPNIKQNKKDLEAIYRVMIRKVVGVFLYQGSKFSLMNIQESQDSRRVEGDYFFNSSLSLLPTSQTLRH